MATSPHGVRAGKAYVELGVHDKLAAGLKRAQARLKAFGAGLQSLGTRLVGMAVAVGVPAAIAVKTFATFEQRMARVQALTGAAGADFQRLANEAKRLGETTVFSAGQAADAMGFFALAGYDVDQILKAIGPTLNLAAAGQLEIAQAADIAAKIMAGMGIEADNLGNAVDVLTKAMTTANTDLNQLGDAMKFVGPIAKSAGIAFEEIVAAVQLLSNAGIQAEMAGTTLRGAILSLTSPSEEAKQKLAELGVSVSDAEGNVRPLADIIADLNRGMAGMGSAERLEALGTIFNARQAAGVAELLSQGADQLRGYTEALKDAGGTASRIAGVQLNTLAGDAIILKSALEGLGIAIGESITRPLRAAVRLLTGVVTAVSQWVREHRRLVVILATSVVAVGAIGAGLVALGVAVKVAAFTLGGLAMILGAVKFVLVAVAAVIGLLFSPVAQLVAVVTTLGVAILAWTEAGGEALMWLTNQFLRLRDFVGAVVAGIVDALQAGDLQLAARILWLGLKVAWEKGTAALTSVWITAKQKFVQLLYDMWYGALIGLQYAWHGLEVAWIETTAGLSKAWAHFTGFMRYAWHGVQNWLIHRWVDLQHKFGGLTDEQAAYAHQLQDQDYAETTAEIDKDKAKDLAKAEAKRAERRDRAKEEHEATLAELRRQWLDREQEINSAAAAQIALAEAELQRAKKELADAIATAKQKRKDVGEDTLVNQARDKVAEVTQKLQDALAGALSASQRISVVGTFNPAAIAGLGGGRPEEITARNTGVLVQVAKRIERKTEPPRFAE